MADPKGEGLKLGFDGSLRLEFHGAKVTSDAGLLAYRDLDEALVLFDSVPSVFHDSRTGRNIQHDLTALLRQSVYSRRAGWKVDNPTANLSCKFVAYSGLGEIVHKEKSYPGFTISTSYGANPADFCEHGSGTT